jgi:hypothetical protein
MIAWPWFGLESEVILESAAASSDEADSQHSILEISFEKVFNLLCSGGCEIEGRKATRELSEHLEDDETAFSQKVCIGTVFLSGIGKR